MIISHLRGCRKVARLAAAPFFTIHWEEADEVCENRIYPYQKGVHDEFAVSFPCHLATSATSLNRLPMTSLPLFFPTLEEALSDALGGLESEILQIIPIIRALKGTWDFILLYDNPR